MRKGDRLQRRRAEQRFRAVMMTAVSFIFAIMPLAISTGAGAGARQAVGVTILGGMAAATTIGLFIIPALLAVIERVAEWSSARPKAETEPPIG